MERHNFFCFFLATCYLVNFRIAGAESDNGLYSRYSIVSGRRSNTAQYKNGRVCVTTCENIYKPVCGSDLKTYRNGCEFKRSKCINNESKFIYLKESCPPYITQCHLTHYCEAGRKVCGTDGVTYASVCHMITAKCNTGIKILSKGACGKSQNFRRNVRQRGYTNHRPMAILESDEDESDEDYRVVLSNIDHVRPRATNIPLVTRTYVPSATGVNSGIRRPNPIPRPGPQPNPRPVPPPRPRPVPRPTQRPWRPILTDRSVRGKISRVTRRPTIEKPVPERPTVVRPPTSLPRVYPRVTVPIILTDAPCNEKCSIEYEPVCGTDDYTYPNACFLRTMACQKGTDLTVWYDGSCIVSTTPAPPTNPPRVYPRITKPVIPTEAPCNEKCSLKFEPVCGTDDNTYPNACVLRAFACRKGVDLTVWYAGSCIVSTTPAPPTPLPRVYPRVTHPIVLTDAPCEENCPLEYEPVCGTDGNTYPNECALRAVACQEDIYLSVKYAGNCIVSTIPVPQTTLPETVYPRVTTPAPPTNLPRVVYPRVTNPIIRTDSPCEENCSIEYEPVCGTDDKTYPSACALRAVACLQNIDLRVSYTGNCIVSTSPIPPTNVPETVYPIITDPIIVTDSPCDEVCSIEYEPVCGTDDKTYPSACVLRAVACQKGIDLTVRYAGNCTGSPTPVSSTSLPETVYPRVTDPIILTDSPCDEQCSLEYEPVCGTDDKTYPSACLLRKVACQNGIDLKVWYNGSCIISQTTVLPTSLPETVYPTFTDPIKLTDSPCAETCSTEYQPVCGTDDKTYSNACVLRVVACQKRIDLKVWYDGSCIVSTTAAPALYTTLVSQEKCVEGCPIEYNPVCGTDGVTYPSACIIESMACLYKNPLLQIDYEGACIINVNPTMVFRLRVRDDPCKDMRCGNDNNDKPVCGSDKNIYNSICELDRRACKLRDNSLVDVEIKQCIPKVKLYIVDRKYVVRLDE